MDVRVEVLDHPGSVVIVFFHIREGTIFFVLVQIGLVGETLVAGLALETQPPSVHQACSQSDNLTLRKS